MSRHTFKGHLFALVTVAIWSSTFIISKVLLEELSPLQVLLARFLVALAALSVLYPHFSKPVSWREEGLFLAIGAALAAYFLLENRALQLTYAANVSLIDATIPLLTGLLSLLLFRKRLFGIRSAAGLVLAYLGVFLIIRNSQQASGLALNGDLLALGAAVMFAVYSLLMEKTRHGLHLVQLTRKVFVYGFVVLAGFALVSRQPPAVRSVSTGTIAGILFLGIAASSLAFILWNQAIRAIGPARTNQYIYFSPLLTTILSAILLDEPVSLYTGAGAALILAGLILADRAGQPKSGSK
ncbi:MAG: DMT family transporter [Clostridiaceae bacterium]|jgi:drug/metabolite transporter (DMT)-like permease|nr:DMT family transporter [Clostridiaceae bacterium]